MPGQRLGEGRVVALCPDENLFPGDKGSCKRRARRTEALRGARNREAELSFSGACASPWPWGGGGALGSAQASPRLGGGQEHSWGHSPVCSVPTPNIHKSPGGVRPSLGFQPSGERDRGVLRRKPHSGFPLAVSLVAGGCPARSAASAPGISDPQDEQPLLGAAPQSLSKPCSPLQDAGVGFHDPFYGALDPRLDPHSGFSSGVEEIGPS